MSRSPRWVIFTITVVVFAVSFGAGGTLALADLSQLGQLETSPETGNQTIPQTSNLDLPERLILPEANMTHSTSNPGVDPGLATSIGFERLTATYEAERLDAEMAAAPSSTEQFSLLRDDVTEVEATIEATYNAERQAFATFAAGGRSSRELLTELGILHERMNTLEYRLDRQTESLRDVSGPEDNVSILRGEITQLKMEASTLRSPLRADVSERIRGDREVDAAFSVQVSPDGYTVGVIRNGFFLTETYIMPNRDRTSADSFSTHEDGRERAATLYPWAFDQSVGIQDLLRGGTYRASVDHPHGVTTTFVDGTTELSFREIQELDLFTMPTEEALTTTSDGIALTVDGTYAGGPAQVTVIESGNETPISDATLWVDGYFVDTTDRSGVGWIVTPGETFELTVVTEETDISYTIRLPENVIPDS